jgi:hypothetical protein
MDYLTANITRMGCKAKDFFSSVLSSLQMYTYTAWSKAFMPAGEAAGRNRLQPLRFQYFAEMEGIIEIKLEPPTQRMPFRMSEPQPSHVQLAR